MVIKKLLTLKNKIKKTDYIALLAPYKVYYFGALVLLILVSLYHILFANKLIPGVYIAGLRVGGQSYVEAVQTLKEFEGITQKNITVTYNGKNYELSGEDIHLRYDWEATVNRAFEVGRTGNVLRDTKDKVAGLFKKLYISAYYDFDETAFDNYTNTIRGDINSPADNAEYILKNETELEIVAERSGEIIDDKKLYNDLVKSFDEFSFGEKLLTVVPSEPEVSSKQLSDVLDQATNVVFNPLVLKHEDNAWEVSSQQKLDFLTFDPEKEELRFNKVAFKTFLDGISSEIYVLPKGKVTSTADNKVESFELMQDGVELDVDATTEAFKTAYFDLDQEATVKTTKISGPVDPKKYGIFALLGEGHSKFTGSASGRIHNLTLAAERTDGVLVPPGALYSFNDSVGDISAATGYNSAWVILGSRTVLGHGGGVCQTSTTLFRAILDAGLPVVSRHPHAYRVQYYEIESPLGIDASIYQPSLDLQFRNDTPNYILIQTSWDLSDSSLVFRLYGTPDGREVEMTEPVITNQSPPPAALYEDDPTLPKGVVQQVDFAAWGATTSFTRKVTRGDEVLYEDVFKTNYQPWRAVYKVGTKE